MQLPCKCTQSFYLICFHFYQPFIYLKFLKKFRNQIIKALSTNLNLYYVTKKLLLSRIAKKLRGLLFDQIINMRKVIPSTGHIICIFIKFHVLCHDHQQDYCSINLSPPNFQKCVLNNTSCLYSVVIVLNLCCSYAPSSRALQLKCCRMNDITSTQVYVCFIWYRNLVKIHYSIIIQRSHKNTFQRPFLKMQEKVCFLIIFLFPKFLLGIT